MLQFLKLIENGFEITQSENGFRDKLAHYNFQRRLTTPYANEMRLSENIFKSRE
jgi:hypothetical protein